MSADPIPQVRVKWDDAAILRAAVKTGLRNVPFFKFVSKVEKF